ncbi:MAG: 16S rRNA (cytosine(967)-C(5))-methyltransferase RsmB [Clostridiales bacterium]|nr:16S rRNA (cytosine(967)-C(5))-methyltransferase RsmB [Clostridiales bacterium]
MGERKPVQGKTLKPHQQEGLPARRLALEVIRDVTEKGKFIHLSMDEKLRACTLPLIDRRLAARLAYDTIENQMYLDHALNQIMARPDCDIKLRNVLRLGACQILLEDRIPESAACNTAVALCKENGMEGLAGVCNGVLRNLIRQREALSWPEPQENPVEALSVRHSVPAWLVEKLLADWGDEAVNLMSCHSHDSYITVRPNLLKMDDAAFESFLNEKVWEHEPGKVAHAWRVRNMAEIAHDAGFVGGKFSIQSESSMMAAMAVEPRRGMQILDCCAAPGGKSCLMAEMMGGTGRVQSWELHEHRTGLIAAQVKRLGLENVRPMTRDASVPRPDLEGTMDAVLLDAPCSGLGVMADKPDVKYRVTPESVAELVNTQRQLLDAVAPYVKRGGTLVYSTCSVLKDENVRQVEAFLARHPEFEAVKLPETIPAEFRQHEGLGLQLLPSRDGVEGFYICRMKRKGTSSRF